jgi:hypothetical protein
MSFKKILLTFMLLGTMLNLLAQSSNSYLSAPDKDLMRITAPLDSFNRQLPVEKVYLHTDKPYYNIGDTLWFKAYLVDGARLAPSKLSGLLYVELDDDSTVVARQVSVKVKDGVAWGQIPLPKAIFREGGYTLRAYTNWMQNFGSNYFFTRRLYLGTPAKDAWMVNAIAKVERIANKDYLQVQLKLNHANNLLSPVGVHAVEVKIYQSRDNQYEFQGWIYKEKLQTGIDGTLNISKTISEKLDGKRIRLEIRNLDKTDGEKVLHVPLTIARNQKIDLQFLPEGGKLVAGLKSVVGFKAIAENGSGTPAAGIIVTAKGDRVASFSTLHNGMGSFEFTPQQGEVYTAKLSQPIIKDYPLPETQALGTVMHIDNPEKGDALNLTLAGLASLGTDTACYLTGISRGLIYYSQKVTPHQSVFIVPKNTFPEGIARFTLFKGIRALNERMVFIDINDRLDIRVTPNKIAYQKRDSVGLNIEVKDKSGFPVQGSFSLAVTDDLQIKPDSMGNNSIAASLLINTELKGYIESPGYYVNRKDKLAWQALDNLLLTQGWTGYEWRDVFSPAKPLVFPVEKEFKVSGYVMNLSHNPIPGMQMILSSQKPQFITTGITDSAGRFGFKHLPGIDSGSFFIQANNKRGRSMFASTIAVDRFKMAPVPLTANNPILPWYVNTDSTIINTIKLKTQKESQENLKMTGIVLNEVKIKQTKVVKGSFYQGGTNLTLDEEDIKKSTTTNLYDLLKLYVPGFKIIRDWKYRHGAVTMKIGDEDFIEPYDLVLDNGPLTFKGAEILTNAKVEGVKKTGTDYLDDPNSAEDFIELLRGYKIGRLKGVQVVLSRSFPLPYRQEYYAKIYVTTSNGLAQWMPTKPGTTTYRPLPILYPQQFYRPKYNVAQPVSSEPDYRATLHWEPNISTDQNGKAKVSFYTSDIAGKYTVTITGFDSTGGIGDGSFKIKINYNSN